MIPSLSPGRPARREGRWSTASDMGKIRINELARELEVKPNRVLELLPEFGVTEKKTHSSSVDDDVANKMRRHFGLLPPEPEVEAPAEAAVEQAAASRSGPRQLAAAPEAA